MQVHGLWRGVARMSGEPRSHATSSPWDHLKAHPCRGSPAYAPEPSHRSCCLALSWSVQGTPGSAPRPKRQGPIRGMHDLD